MNLNDNPRGGTYCLGNAGIIIDASAKADAETLADIPYCINGKMYTLTSGDGDIKLDGFTVAAGYTCLFLAQADTSGTITVTQGTAVTNAALAAGTAVLKWPELTADNCPLGALKVKNASSAVFTGGTTLLDASDITTTAINLFSVPVTPVTS